MSTWAERLSSKRTSQQSTPVMAPSPEPANMPGALTPLAPQAPPFSQAAAAGCLRRGGSVSNVASPTGLAATPGSHANHLEASPSPWSVSAHASPAAGASSLFPSAGASPGDHSQTLEAIREEFRQQAELRNRDPMEVPFIHIPLDCWEWVTAYVHYTDVLRLASTCRRLWVLLRYRDSIWEQQLRFFHEDVLAMRGGTLLLSQFAIPSQPTMFRYEWFLRERLLYVRDARREWHFKEFTQLDDNETGSFTVAIHEGVDATQSTANAPLSRPPPEAHLGPTHEGVDSASQSSAPPPPTAPQQQQQQHMRRVGEPLMLTNVPPLVLTVERPLRAGENARDFVFHGEADAGVDMYDEEAYDEDDYAGEEGDGGEAWGDEDVGHEEYRRLQESTGMTEEELLQYVLAISQAEAEDAAAAAASSQSAEADPHDLSEANTLVRGVAPTRPRYIPTLAAPLKPSELMTLVDFLNHGSAENSRLRVMNITHLFNAQCGAPFAHAVAETLRSTMRRRLHFESHHRALLNNGETRRHRLGRPTAITATPTTTADAEEVRAGGAAQGSSHVGQARPLQASDIPGGYPINKMFRHFTGKLVEISRQEAQLIATGMLAKPQLLDDFCVFPLPRTPSLPAMRPPAMATACGVRRQQAQHTHVGDGEGTYQVTKDVMPPQTTRFFLAPELCVGGRVGLLLIDPVRLLVVVEAERVVCDDPSWAGPLRVERTGRVHVPGQGYNAQYYEIDEYRGRFI